MKKTIVAIFAIGLMVAACQNPADDSNPPDDGSSDGGQVYQSGQEFTGSGKVYFRLYDPSTEHADYFEIGAITNGKLAFTLPATVADKYFGNPLSGDTGRGYYTETHYTYGGNDGSSGGYRETGNETGSYTVTPPSVKVKEGRLSFKRGAGYIDIYRGMLNYLSPSSEQQGYIYATQAVTLNGTITNTYTRTGFGTNPDWNKTGTVTETMTYDNLTLEKGWNTYYIKLISNQTEVAPYTNIYNGSSSFTMSNSGGSGLIWMLD